MGLLWLETVRSGADSASEPQLGLRKTYSSQPASVERMLAFRTEMLAYAMRLAEYSNNRASYIRELQKLLTQSPFFKEVVLRENEALNQKDVQSGKDIFLNIELVEHQFSEQLLEYMKTLPESKQDLMQKANRWMEIFIREAQRIYLTIQANKLDRNSGLYNEDHLQKWIKAHVMEANFKKWVSDEKLTRTSAPHLIHFGINMRSFAAKNDYFNHSIGDEILKKMGDNMKALRHEIHRRYNIPYEQIAVHRAKGVNFTLSVEIPHDMADSFPFDEVNDLIKRTIENEKFLIDWDWNELPKLGDFSAESILAAVRSLRQHGGRVNLQEIPHYRSRDILPGVQPHELLHQNPITGIRVNVGYYHYDPNFMLQMPDDVYRFIDAALKDLNAYNPEGLLDYRSEFLERLRNQEGIDALGEYFMNTAEKGRLYLQETQENRVLEAETIARRAVTPSRELLDLQKKCFECNYFSEVGKLCLNYLYQLPSLKIRPGFKSLQILEIKEFQAQYGKLKGRRPLHALDAQTWAFPVFSGSQISNVVVLKHADVNLMLLRDLLKNIQYFDYIFSNFDKHALLDPATGMLNAAAAFRDLNQRFQKGQPFGFAMFDFNKFSGFDISFGAESGDAVMKMASVMMMEVARKHHQQVYRQGGEEFYLIGDNSDETLAALKEMDQVFARLIHSSEDGPRVRVSWAHIENRIRQHVEKAREDTPTLKVPDFTKARQSYVDAVRLLQPELSAAEIESKPNQEFDINPLLVYRFVLKTERWLRGLTKMSGFKKAFPGDYRSVMELTSRTDAFTIMAKEISKNNTDPELSGNYPIIYSDEGPIP